MSQQVRILVVEDDNDINQLLCNIAQNSGYLAQPAFSGTEAMIYLENQEWDLVLLDLMLPGMNGEAILSKISRQSHVPIIIISAKIAQHNKIDALRTGADDYITKPFDVEEVSARIDSVLRRYSIQSQPAEIKQLRFKDICIDIDSKTIYVNKLKCIFTAREYAILVTLLSAPQKVFTKANLFESVWQEEFHGDDNTINVHMSNIRRKLADANPNEVYIETIWGMGYRLKT